MRKIPQPRPGIPTVDGRQTIGFFSDRPFRRVLLKIWSWQQHRPHHLQPRFCSCGRPAVENQNQGKPLKRRIRNYHGRMGDDDLKIWSNHIKPFLETAPGLLSYLKSRMKWVAGEKKENYYVQESVGIAAGLLIAAIHQAVWWPSPYAIAHAVSGRNFGPPWRRKGILLVPVGYPAEGAVGFPIYSAKPGRSFKMYV